MAALYGQLGENAKAEPLDQESLLKGTESDLAIAVLRYKGVVLDSVIEDHQLAEACRGSEDQKLVEQLNQDKNQLGQLLLQPSPNLSTNANQRNRELKRVPELNPAWLRTVKNCRLTRMALSQGRLGMILASKGMLGFSSVSTLNPTQAGSLCLLHCFPEYRAISRNAS